MRNAITLLAISILVALYWNQPLSELRLVSPDGDHTIMLRATNGGSHIWLESRGCPAVFMSNDGRAQIIGFCDPKYGTHGYPFAAIYDSQRVPFFQTVRFVDGRVDQTSFEYLHNH